MIEETPETAYRIMHERVTGEFARAGDKALSANQYDAARRKYLSEVGERSRPGVGVWPPTSQTLMHHLGAGSWARAMETLGLSPNTGRARGTGSFSDDDYRAAVAAFLERAADEDDDSVTSDAFAHYVAWSTAQRAAGIRRPSGAAVRKHFGSWAAAKQSIASA